MTVLTWEQTATPARPEALRIAWAPFAHEHAPSGYGVIARELRLALEQAGAHILPTTTFGWDCVVAVSLPVAWAVGNGQYRPDLVYHTMYEMDRLPADWPAVLNGCGLAWVPSTYCEQLFRESGVTAPIMRSGYGVDETIFHTGGRQPNDGPLRFIAWGPGFAGRKNLLMAARAFKCAHLPPDEAVLEIKVNESFGEPIFKDDDGNVIDNITAVAANWPASMLADWLRTADVLIYPSGGEGFGLQPSLPEVVGDAGLLVDPKDAEGFAVAMWRVLQDPALRAELSAKGLRRAKNFSWEKTARETLALYDRLEL